MGESMEDYKEELQQSYKKLEESDVDSGKVESEEEAEHNMTWNRLKELKDTKESIKVKVNAMVNGGLTAYVENVRGFIPASQLSLEYVENLDEYLGKTLDVRVITADPNKNKLVLSAKAILKEAADKKKQEKIDSLTPGTVMEGTVESLQPYGAFIDLGDGISGLLHISQISEKRLKTPGEVLKEGQSVTVRILKAENGKLSLTMKAVHDSSENKDGGVQDDYKLPKSKPLTTSLGDLLKNIKLE